MMMMLVLMIMNVVPNVNLCSLGYYYGPGDYDGADDHGKGGVVMILVLI